MSVSFNANSIKRIKQCRFTEADVKALLVEARNYNLSEVLTEIGHIVAHPMRDRGIVYNRISSWYANVIGATHRVVEGNLSLEEGSTNCPWWLKTYLESLLVHVDPSKIDLNGNRFSKRSDIVRYYFSKEKYPQRLSKPVDEYLLTLLGRDFDNTGFRNPFVGRRDLRENALLLLRHFNISAAEVLDHVIVAIQVLFHKLRISLPGDAFVDCELSVQGIRRQVERGRPHASITCVEPHGYLTTMANVNITVGDFSPTICIPLILSDVPSEPYLTFWEVPHGQRVKNHPEEFWLDCAPLYFDSTREYPIGTV